MTWSNNGVLPMSTKSGGGGGDLKTREREEDGERERKRDRRGRSVLKGILVDQEQSSLRSEREAERFYPVSNPSV